MALQPISSNELNQLHAGYQATIPQQNAATHSSGGLGGFLHSVLSPAEYFANAAIVNPVKELAAQATGNKQAYQNAVQSARSNLAGSQNVNSNAAQASGEFLKKLTGNTAGLATMALAPEAKAGVAANAVQGAKIGAIAGGGSALANDQNVVKGALEGGATGGALGGAAGILSKLSGGTSKLAATHAAQSAEKAQNAERVGLESEFKNVPKSIRQSSDLQGTMQTLQNLGVQPTKENLKTFSGLVTGENGIVSGTVRQLLGNVGEVHTGNVLNDAREALLGEAGQLGNVEDRASSANGVMRSIRNTLQGTAMKGKGSLGETADANDAFDAVKKLESRVQDLGGTQAPGSNGAEARVTQAAANSLKDKIGSEANPTIQAHILAPEDINAIRSAVEKAGGDHQISDYIINGINNAKNINDLRAIQRPFVNASKLANAADVAEGGSLTESLSHSPTAADEATNIGTNLLLGNRFGIAQNAGRLAQKSGVLDKLIGGAGKVASGAETASGTTAGSLASRLLTPSAGLAAGNPATPANPQESPADIASAGSQLTSDLTSGQPTQSDQTQQPAIDQGTLVALIASDPQNASTYLSLYNALKPAQPSQTLLTQRNAAANAENALSQIEQSFQAAGGGKGKLGGTLENLAGRVGLNSNAATYNDTATAMAAQIYKALGNTGTISDADQRLIKNLLPKTTDTNDTATQKLNQLSNLLQQAQANAGGGQ